LEQYGDDVVNDAPGSVFAPGLIFTNRYRIDEPIATGGMAQVWRGEDLILQRNVAVKILHPHLAADEVVMDRFRHEAIAAARLSHPNIVPTFDTGSDHGVSYIVLGLVDGPNLSDLLRQQTFDPVETCGLGSQIADALDHAHHHGIIHRDVKPANVLVVDDHERVMVADFGIARLITESLDPDLTMPGVALGTPEYVAPELIDGKDPTPSIDIFALGVLLHEMNCGHTIGDVPTQDVGPDDTGSQQVCPQLPDPLGTIVFKATRHDPADRYESAAQMRDALHEAENKLRKSRPSEPAPVETDPNPTQAVPRISPPSRFPTATKQPVRDVALARVAAQKRRTWTFAAIILLIAMAVGIGRFFGSLSDNSDRTTKTQQQTAISLVSATSFDPQGSDRVENENASSNVLDANAATSWATETYGNRKFGNLKQGVGLTLTLSSSAELEDLTISSATNDWAADIYVVDQPVTQLAGWGNPVTGNTKIAAGSTTFNLDGTEGSHVLIWITDLGSVNRVNITDVAIRTH
jgi:serine/threonine protein kinase